MKYRELFACSAALFLLAVFLAAAANVQAGDGNPTWDIWGFFRSILGRFAVTGYSVRDVDFSFGWGAGYSFDDTYRVRVPSGYNGCFIRIYASNDCPGSYIKTSAKSCSSQDYCQVGASPGETIDIIFTPDSGYSCYDQGWEYWVKNYDWCGDGECQYYTDSASCVNGQIMPEDCGSCPEDCLDSGNVCCDGVEIDGGECCTDSDCSPGEECSSYECVTSSGQGEKDANGQACDYDSECQSDWCSYVCCEHGKPCCASDYNCQPDYQCGPDHYCIRRTVNNKAAGGSCVYNTECQSGWCSYGVCCAYGKRCCLYSSECGSGQTCGSGFYCVEPAASQYSNGHSCLHGSDCSSGNCENDVCCAYGKTCCSYDYECPSDYACSLDYFYCVYTSEKLGAGEHCSSDSDCEEGLWCNWLSPYDLYDGIGACCEYGKGCCDNPSGDAFTMGEGKTGKCNQDYTVEVTESAAEKYQNGHSCDNDADCSSGNCKNDVCCEYGKTCCSYGYECPAGYSCSSGDYYCVYQTAKKTKWESCSVNDECETGLCSGGVCTCYDCDGNLECDVPNVPCSGTEKPESAPITGTKELCEECGGNSECKSGLCLELEGPSGNSKNLCALPSGSYTTSTDCCSASQCAEGYECRNFKCAGKQLLEAFYSRYEISSVRYKDSYVPKSAMYNGLSAFYKEQADQIDLPVAGAGKSVILMNDIKSLAMSAGSVNPVSFAISVKSFSDDLRARLPSESAESVGTAENLFVNSFAVYSLMGDVATIAGKSAQLDSAIASLTSGMPGNRVTQAISSRQSALRQKLIPDEASQKQLALLGIADLVMEKTLISDVKETFGYSIIDYTEKIQLSVMSRELAKLYKKAESRSLKENEAVSLMILEHDFWALTVARNKNHIANEETASFLKKNWNRIAQSIFLANQESSVQAAEDEIRYAEPVLNRIESAIGEVFR